MYHTFKRARILFVTLFLLNVAGCANQGLSHATQSPIKLNASEMAYFWVTKDTLISWQQIFPQSATSSHKKTSYTVSFIIDTSGAMKQVNMVSTVDGTKIPAEKLTDVSNYQFYPTAKNFSRQAVMVNTIVEL